MSAPELTARVADAMNAFRDQILIWVAGRSENLERRWATRWMGLFWSVAIGIIATLLPLSILAVLRPAADAPIGAIIALVLVALAAYVSDWKAGLAAITVSAIVISRWATRDGAEPELALRYLIGSIAVGGAAIVGLIERLKNEGSIDRQEALAARSAATALAAVENVAATHQNLSAEARSNLYHAIVRSVVGVNRAHAGALLLIDPDSDTLETVALYGFGVNAEEALRADAAAEDGFVSRVRQERRTLQLSGIQRTSGERYADLRRTRIKSVLGSAAISGDDTLLGVIMVGLLVDHRFTPREQRKLDALASQVAAILETMSVMDRREFQLQQARDEQRRLEQVIATVPEALIVSAPPTGEIIAMNDAARSLFSGLEAESVLQSVKPVDTESSILSPTERALTFGESVDDVECLIELPDSKSVPVLASAAPIPDDEGAVVAVVTAFRDISALKEAARLKDEFVSVVSHELRSPLTPIRGFVQLVARDLDREGGHDVQVRRLESVSGHVDRLTRLVDDLLDVSRLRSGSLEIRPVPTDLVELSRHVAEAWGGAASPVDIELDTELDKLEGSWDPDRIHQVLDNLVINAVKYSPAGAKIVLSLNRDGDTAIISVKDQGPGIDNDQKAEIFSAFYRTPEARTGQVQGLGLGLFICQALVAEHGGSIDLESEIGKGSSFIVRLPIREQHDEKPVGDDAEEVSAAAVVTQADESALATAEA